ncbi:MAG: PAS domain-containing protein [Anaerolineales bacterium]|nr:PAS domain-containing protein [Anaerolineales bacterium]
MDFKVYFLLVALVLSLATLAWVAFRYASLRRQLREYQRVLRQAIAGSISVLSLPSNLKHLENLSNAVKALVTSLATQLSSVDANRARLAAVLDQMTDAVLIASEAGRIQFANPAAEKLFGRGLVGRSVTETLRNHQLIQAWQRCQELDEIQIEAAEIVARRLFLQLIVMPDQHAPGGSLLVVQDLTRIRRLETIRRDFISNISHELRTPLASLKALTETLQDGALADPEAAPRFIGRIATEVDALTQMAQELLDLSRIESGQVELARKPVAPKKLLTSAAERMRLQAERAGLSLRVDCLPNLPKVNADAPRIEQVLVNLIHNAVKFTRPGGEVILIAEVVPSAEAGEGAVRFAVKDTGVGIPADDVPRIFERFYRVDKSRAGGGTGLGLSISRHLVESHGGQIWAESREGEGSMFFFTLPNA